MLADPGENNNVRVYQTKEVVLSLGEYYFEGAVGTIKDHGE